MAKTKEKSMKSGGGAKGGSSKMFPKMGVQPAEAGVAAPLRAPSANNSPAKGGSSMSSKQGGAAPAVAGQVSSGGRGGDNSFKVSGGPSRMAGFTPASNARPR